MLALLGSLKKAVSAIFTTSNSLRTRASNSAYLTRTFASTPTTFTLSMWVKRGSLSQGAVQALVCSRKAGTGTASLQFNGNDTIGFAIGNVDIGNSTAVFRDSSSWYHIVARSTASGSAVVYVNNNIVISGTANAAGYLFNSSAGWVNAICEYGDSLSNYFDGYLTEVNFIDGQALTPSSFGQISSTTGVWSPIAYTGSYGTNGFYLKFADASAATAAAIGKDSSGNGNNWTPSGISVTAGATYDSMIDVPTNYADGGNGRGNYATWNPLYVNLATYADANLKATTTITSAQPTTFFRNTGKFYWEIKWESGANFRVGICNESGIGQDLGGSANGWCKIGSPARVYNNGVTTAYGTDPTLGDIINCALDLDAGKIWYGINGVWQASGDPASGVNPSQTFTANQSMSPAIASGTGTLVYSLNCGQRPFAYTPPTGFVALNTQNLPTPAIANGASVMAATTYTGTGSALTITNTNNGVSFQPDFVWLKGRSGATDHALYDVVRGTTKDLVSNSTAAETTQATGLTAFNADGFGIGALAKLNTAAATYIAWQWKAGGAAVSNTAGTITSQVSANTTAGFSVVTYTGTVTNATVGHGLGVAPKLIIIKDRLSSVLGWTVYHSLITATNYLTLNTTDASALNSLVWNSTQPTSSVFSLGTSGRVNAASQYIAYCFAEIAGFSKFGSYTGNGSTDGPFAYCGFRPRFVMVKNSSVGGSAGYDWIIHDTTRATYNVDDTQLIANSANAENVDSGGSSTVGLSMFDITSNGFKIRTSSAGRNSSGATYIFAAFAENPSKYALAR